MANLLTNSKTKSRVEEINEKIPAKKVQKSRKEIRNQMASKRDSKMINNSSKKRKLKPTRTPRQRLSLGSKNQKLRNLSPVPKLFL